MPQWLYLFRLKSAIWTGPNLVSQLQVYTVEPRYNEDLWTMKITLLYQVSPLYQVEKTKKNKELGPAKPPCYKRVFVISDLFITRFHCIKSNVHQILSYKVLSPHQRYTVYCRSVQLLKRHFTWSTIARGHSRVHTCMMSI